MKNSAADKYFVSFIFKSHGLKVLHKGLLQVNSLRNYCIFIVSDWDCHRYVKP